MGKQFDFWQQTPSHNINPLIAMAMAFTSFVKGCPRENLNPKHTRNIQIYVAKNWVFYRFYHAKPSHLPSHSGHKYPHKTKVPSIGSTALDPFASAPLRPPQSQKLKQVSRWKIGGLHCGNWGSPFWLCQNSYWKWWFIVDFPIENGDFQ